MKFEKIKARRNWRERADEAGYLTAILDNPPYWVEALDEPFCGVFTMEEVESVIETATSELYEMSLQAVDFVVNSASSERCFDALKIAPQYRNAIRRSWRRHDRTIYGRFDFSYKDGSLKLLELNFDTPTSLYEASILQWFWLEDLKDQKKLPETCDQFNSLHERLIDSFEKAKSDGSTLHLASVQDSAEDVDTVKYLQSCAIQAGLDARFIFMQDLGFDSLGRLIDLSGNVISQLFKLYPWEQIMYEDAEVKKRFGRQIFSALAESNYTKFIEPSWKMILSNKAILPLLWQLFPGHKNLLETAFDDESNEAHWIRQSRHVRKPIFGREGGSVSIVDPESPDKVIEKESVYGAEGFILQAMHELPKHNDYHLVMGSWVVDGQPAGMGLRADLSPITGNTAIFVPHYIRN
ncbi:MAG TPA: glutathionylspermidine synthase family protein [Candidatus Melainabacteria bacterium]|nr:glutathionylspermidine synthase family protein [Candidatus Melainabacteria bacterium]